MDFKKFEKIQDQFCDQVSELITNKQKLESKHNFEKGEKHAIALTLLNNKSPLPLNMPSMHVMHEMISDEICKVCNREAKKDSDAYNYMKSKIDAFIDQHQNDNNNKDESLFKK